MWKILVFLIALTVFCHVPDVTGNSISLTENSEKCPSQPITARCELNSPERRLLWMCTHGEGPPIERPVHCGSGESIRDLNCDQGRVKVALISCNDSIVSDATYNVTNSSDSIVCTDFTNDTLTAHVSFGAKVPPPPILNVQSVNAYTEITAQNVTFEWMLENNTNYVLSVNPVPPQCSEPCLYRTDQGSLSIPLRGGVLYNITGRAEKCNGTLNSDDSKLVGFILQVPGSVECNSTQFIDGDLVRTVVQWKEPLVTVQDVNVVTQNISSYLIRFISQGETILNKSIPVQSSHCSDGMCTFRHTFKSPDSRLSVLIAAKNQFGTGEELECLMSDFEMERDESEDALSTNTIIGIVAGLGVLLLCTVLVVAVLVGALCTKIKRCGNFPVPPDEQELQERNECDAPVKPNPKQYQMKVITGQLHREQQHFYDQFTTEKGSSTDKPLKCGKARGIAVSKSRIIITDEEQQTNNAFLYLVRVFNREPPNELLFKIVGPFNTPRGVAIDEDGNIYIADSDKHRILKFNEKGKYQDQRRGDDKFGSENVELRKPYGLHIENGLLYVCDSGNSWIQIFDLELNLRFRLGGQHAKPRFLYCPVGIAYNPADKHFYVVDTHNNLITRIQINFERESCEVTPFSTEQCLHKMRGIVVINGHIIVTQVTRHSIVCLTVDGEMKSKRDIKYPIDLAVYEDTVYVCSGSDEVDTIQHYLLNELINDA